MFITQRIKAAIQGFRTGQATKSFGGSMDGFYGGLSGLTSRNHDLTFTEEGAATAFGIIVEVQRGVMFIADSISMLPAGIYDSRTDELLISLDTREEINVWTPGATFIRAVRQYENQWKHNFFDSISFSDWLYGETFVARMLNAEEGVTGIRWLNPLYTCPVIMRGQIERYDYSGDDGYYPIDRDAMAYRIHHRNPYDDLRGISPVLSALPSMNISRNAERGVMGYFKNGMILGGMMMPESDTTNLSGPQMTKLERDMTQHHRGVDNAFRWVMAPVRMAMQMFDQPDLQKNYAVSKDASKKIMMALGVPPELAGNPDSVSYDNADKIMKNWLRVNGRAYANKIEGFINTSLLPYFEPNRSVYFKFDFTQIDQQDAALTQADFSAGIVPMNVAQAQRGYEVDERAKDIYRVGDKMVHIDTLIRDAKGVENTPGKIAYNQNGIAIPQGQVFQYHIDTGAVDTNEVRAGFGLPPKAAQQDDSLQRLQAQFTTMAAGVTAGLPPALVAQMVGLQLPPGAVPTVTVDPLAAPNLLTAGAPPTEPTEPQKGAASLCVMLSLANNPDLIDLQKRLKALYPNPSIKWNDPASFRVTLIYAPAVDDTQIADVLDVLPDLSAEGLALKVGQLNCFDNVGEQALHFRIARNSALSDLQASLYDACDINGLQLSGHSLPERYIPHITMGYLPEKIGRITFHGKISVVPIGVICSVERGGEDEIVYPVEDPDTETASLDPAQDAAKTVTLDVHAGHTHDVRIASRDYSPDKALTELKAWQTFTARGKSSRPFVFEMLKGDPADYIAERQAAGDAPAEIAKALKPRFDGSRLKALTAAFEQIYEQSWVDIEGAIKSLSSLESDFTSRFAPVIESMRDGQLSSRQRAGTILRQLIRTFGAAAYREGLKDGGIEDDPDEREQAEINSLISEQSGYVSSLTERVLGKDGENDTLAAGQASIWFRKSIQPFYYAGYASAKSNQMMEFTGDDGLESCSTCQHLKGQRHRLWEWMAKELIPQVNTKNYECGGWKCAHSLTETTGKARGKW